jgi:hypothetical protein
LRFYSLNKEAYILPNQKTLNLVTIYSVYTEDFTMDFCSRFS